MAIRSCWRTRTKVSLLPHAYPSFCSHRPPPSPTVADEERVFLISEELEFRTGETDGEPTLVWRDLEGDIDEFYEFVASGTNEPTRAFFETCMYRAMYERKYKSSANALQDKDLEEFIRQWVLPTVQRTSLSC